KSIFWSSSARGRLLWSYLLRASSRGQPAWKKHSCVLRDEARGGGAFAASRSAGWDEARNSTSPGCRTEIKESGVGREAARDDVRILPQAPALLQEDEFFARSSGNRALLRGDVARGLGLAKVEGLMGDKEKETVTGKGPGGHQYD